jgi:hypothetical protein
MVQAMAGVSPAWLVTVPLPVPPPVTFTRKVATDDPAKTARTFWLVARVTVQVGAVPVQAPRHSFSRLPAAAVAVRVTVECLG